MTFEEAERYVHSFTRFGSQKGLERMRKLLRMLGDPQDKLRFVHVAGSNGKGSIVRLTAAALQEAGYRVGMYISPYVVEFRERFQINGEMIPKDAFAALVEEIDTAVRELAAQEEYITEFEMITAVAFLYFRRMACDIVVLEVGIGGRLDVTNVIPTPLCAVVATISLDHTDILGDTLEKIAGEKAGIVKANTDLVVYPWQEPDVLAVFMERCAETGSRLHQPNPQAVQIREETAFGSVFSYNGHTYRLRLAGRQQIYNALTVLSVLAQLSQKGFPVAADAIDRALSQTTFPARFEILSEHPLVILDGAHNREAAEALAKNLHRLEQSPVIGVMGMMADKDYAHAAAAIGQECKTVFTIPVSANPRAIDPERLADAAKKGCRDVRAFPDAPTALREAFRLAGRNGAVIVCGSFYLASELRPLLQTYLGEAQVNN